ncbi:universal stress protein [Pseudarthrobacter oxydans]|uniref:universal stress protein n=1 Tax=Pseudarthrobacter oxydans TaxID=1671 RepID=UPI0035205567
MPRALSRLAESTDASMLMVGGQRPGRAAAMTRMLEGSVSVSLMRSQTRPVVVVPHSGRDGPGLGRAAVPSPGAPHGV